MSSRPIVSSKCLGILPFIPLTKNVLITCGVNSLCVLFVWCWRLYKVGQKNRCTYCLADRAEQPQSTCSMKLINWSEQEGLWEVIADTEKDRVDIACLLARGPRLSLSSCSFERHLILIASPLNFPFSSLVMLTKIIDVNISFSKLMDQMRVIHGV